MAGDPWDMVPVTLQTNVPRWMIELAREEYEDPTMTGEDLVGMWVENMEANTYDCARDDGKLPPPPLGGGS